MHETDPGHAVTATGRLIGGTLDVIGMLPGTMHGDLEAFAGAYAAEVLLVYLDDCDFNPAQYCRMLHHLKLAGWLRHANALLIGRTAAEDLRELTPQDALRDAVGDVTIAVIYDMHIGHLPLQLILVNGPWRRSPSPRLSGRSSSSSSLGPAVVTGAAAGEAAAAGGGEAGRPPEPGEPPRRGSTAREDKKEPVCYLTDSHYPSRRPRRGVVLRGQIRNRPILVCPFRTTPRRSRRGHRARPAAPAAPAVAGR